MATPNFKMMWKAFPDHKKYPTLAALHTFIGGALARNIHSPGFGPTGNTCAVRLSYALNQATLPISKKLATRLDIETLTGLDGKHYIFRVAEMKKYLTAALGVTPITARKDFQTAFLKQMGIVSFDVLRWNNASGHLALWNGHEFREPNHDDYRFLRDNPTTLVIEPTTVAIHLWKMGGGRQ